MIIREGLFHGTDRGSETRTNLIIEEAYITSNVRVSRLAEQIHSDHKVDFSFSVFFFSHPSRHLQVATWSLYTSKSLRPSRLYVQVVSTSKCLPPSIYIFKSLPASLQPSRGVSCRDIFIQSPRGGGHLRFLTFSKTNFGPFLTKDAKLWTFLYGV